ncbi:MAG: DNRLRE domain-containing protein [Thermoproteota archaeon]
MIRDRMIRRLVTIMLITVCYTVFLQAFKIEVTPAGVSPITKIFYPSQDAVVFEGDPHINYGSNGEMGVNYRIDSRDRSFIMFDLSSIPPGSTVISATINLYVYRFPSVKRTIECYELSEEWDEFKITWVNQPGTRLLVSSLTVDTRGKNWISLKVTDSVAKYLSKDIFNYVRNYGWMLKDSVENVGTSDDPIWMYAKEILNKDVRPYLELKFYPPRLELDLSSDSIQAGNWVGMTVYRKTYNGDPITRGPLKVKLHSNSTSSAKRFSLIPGDSAITELTIPDSVDFVSLYYYDEKAGSCSITVSASEYVDYQSDTKIIKVTPGPLDRFNFSPIPSSQLVSVPFIVTITAYDIYGNIKTDYNGVNTISDTTGTIRPSKTSKFVNGRWSGKVVINKTGLNVRIITVGEDKVGESNPFIISTGPPAKIAIEPSSFTMAVGVAYSNISISLRDVSGFETAGESDMTIGLFTSSPKGEFRKPDTNIVVATVVIPAGNSSVNVEYYDEIIGNHTLIASSIGLTQGRATVRVMPDTTPPVTTLLVEGPRHQVNETLYLSELSLIILSANDDLSGVGETWYRVDGGSWKEYTHDFSLSEYAGGLHLIEYYSVDKAGIREGLNEARIFLDRSPPRIESASPIGDFVTNRKSVVFTVNATDLESGVSRLELIVDDNNIGEMTLSKSIYTGNFNLSEGAHTWVVEVFDNVDNSVKHTYSFNLILDTKPPKITLLNAPSSIILGETATITCGVSEDSGLRGVYLYYSTDKGSSWSVMTMLLKEGVYTSYIPPQTLFTEVQYYVEALDKAGNRARTEVSRYVVDMPTWIYFLIVALLAVLIAILSLRRKSKT